MSVSLIFSSCDYLVYCIFYMVLFFFRVNLLLHVNMLIQRADDQIKLEMLNILRHDVEGKPIEPVPLNMLEDAKKMIENELRPVGLIEIIS